MQNHYKTLGLTNAASTAEIRRAYRILARRYHPDVNPSGNSDALFKEIAQAYAVLSDAEKKQQYDLELAQSKETFDKTFQRAQETLRRNQRAAAYAKQQGARAAQSETSKDSSHTQGARRASYTPKKPAKNHQLHQLAHKIKEMPRSARTQLKKGVERASQIFRALPTEHNRIRTGHLAVLEVSISMRDAIQGTRKAIELPDNETATRKVSICIPPGVRTGSLIRLRNKERENEEIIVIISVEHHPWLSLGDRGLTMEIPLTLSEAINGAKIQVPSFGDPLLVTVEPDTQSGKEVRLKGQGLTKKDGTRGDLFIRFIVIIPSKHLSSEFESAIQLITKAYPPNIREHLPKRLGE